MADTPAADDPLSEHAPVVVASMARTGSTLLQRILNTHPDLTVWGEHNGFLTPLRTTYRTVVGHKYSRLMAEGRKQADDLIGPISTPESFIPWVGPFAPREFDQAVRRFLVDLFTAPLQPHVRWGFKEVRYSVEDLRFIRKLFPRATFLITVRDRRSQIRSRILAFNTPPDVDPDGSGGTEEMVRARVAKMDEGWRWRMRGYATFVRNNPDTVRAIGYRQLGDESHDIGTVFDFLDLARPDPALLASVRRSRSGATSAMRDAAWTDEQIAVVDRVLDELEHDDEIGAIHDTFSEQL